MHSMFSGCIALETLDLSNFDTPNVTKMIKMFDGCTVLKTLDLSDFDTQNLKDMEYMFNGCSALTTIYTSGKYVTTACKEDENMFAGCTNLVGAVPYDKNKVGKEMANYTTGYFTYKASKTAVSYVVFDESTNTLTFKHDTNKPTEAFVLKMDYAGPTWQNKKCRYIEKVIFDASFANARPTSCYEWFHSFPDLITIEGLEYLNTQNVTNMSHMFSASSALTTLDLSNFNTQNVTNMTGMFEGCNALKTLDLSNFNTQNVKGMTNMFEGCNALKTLDLSNFDTRNVGSMGWMFEGCFALKTLDLSSFDTQNVTGMQSMFKGCSALTTIYASEKYVTTACTSDDNMFVGCIHLMGAVPYDKNKIDKEMANYTTGYFTYKAATGIDAPTVSDDTTAEYYDLQGRRLNAPQKGVNIVKRGKKTTKMLVK